MALHPLIGNLEAIKTAGQLSPYIDYIRFPRFRNLEADTRIDFSFPLTVFVGQNGCGKSSALQALFGCPKGRSVGTYWFTTSVDPILDLSPEDRHCLIYSYDSGGQAKEVLKTRINKANQPDLWDTSEPIGRYAMLMGSRTSPVDKHVVYVNFRAVQSAFEKAFHEERPPRVGIQNHLRSRSWYLRRVLDGGRKKLPHFHGAKTHEPAVQLSPVELEMVGKILGREYTSAKIIKHRLFDLWGYSVILTTPHASYSEAFAGSGETAIVLLVHEVLQSPANSLLLLDEPETSLHPGAQRQVLDFLLQQCVKSKHQVVICTHAPALLDSLPASAVKVFAPTPTGSFRVAQNVLPNEAFYFLGQRLADKHAIIVEDRLAKRLVEEVLLGMGNATRNLFEISYHPGGENVMKQDAIVYSRDDPSKIHLLFDGDQKPSAPIFDPGTMSTIVDSDPDQAIPILTEAIRSAARTEPRFPSDGGAQGGNKAQQRDLRKKYLRYFRTNAWFFPMRSLEQAIWDESISGLFLDNILPATQVAAAKAALNAELNFKNKFVILSDALCGTSSATTLETLHSMLIKAWVKRAPQEHADTILILNTIKNLA